MKSEKQMHIRLCKIHLARSFTPIILLLTCRIATCRLCAERIYWCKLPSLTIPVRAFVYKWFCCQRSNKHNKLIQKLKKKNPRIQELATNPLLLTLCTVFEECADFSLNRSTLWRRTMNVLLKKENGMPSAILPGKSTRTLFSISRLPAKCPSGNLWRGDWNREN